MAFDKAYIARNDYPETMRMITARLEVDGKMVILTFLTSNMEWSAVSIRDLYKSRWGIEVFFKQLQKYDYFSKHGGS